MDRSDQKQSHPASANGRIPAQRHLSTASDNLHGAGPRKDDVDADADDESADRIHKNVYRHPRPEEYAAARSRLKLASELSSSLHYPYVWGQVLISGFQRSNTTDSSACSNRTGSSTGLALPR